MDVEVGQLVFKVFNNADSDESQWEYAVVTAVFDDRFIATCRYYRTVYYTSDEAKKKHSKHIEKNNFSIDILKKDGKPIILKKKRFLWHKPYYTLPNGTLVAARRIL